MSAITGRPRRPAYVLAIRGYEFELGEELSKRAALNLEAALAFLAGRLTLPMTRLVQVNARTNGQDTLPAFLTGRRQNDIRCIVSDLI